MTFRRLDNPIKKLFMTCQDCIGTGYDLAHGGQCERCNGTGEADW
jgi:DnaJ-class molecular chaperone